MIIKCADESSIEKLTPKSRKKIIFSCDNCSKESTRIYNNYIKNDINLCRSCIAKEVNSRPEVKRKNSEYQKNKWNNTDTSSIKKNISKGQKNSWKNGRSGKTKNYTYNFVYNSFLSENYILLITEEEYHTNSKWKYKCSNNHIGYTDYNHWFIRKQRCGKCSKNAPLLYDNIKKSFESEQYQVLYFKNSKKNIIYLCPNNHIGGILWEHWKRGHRCSTCYYESTSSKPEREIQKYISEIYNGKIINNDRNTIINPLTNYNLELDIYLPELNKAIEFNGTYWHSNEKSKLYDKIKADQCEKNNIDLLVIDEDKWMKDKEECLLIINKFI